MTSVCLGCRTTTAAAAGRRQLSTSACSCRRPLPPSPSFSLAKLRRPQEPAISYLRIAVKRTSRPFPPVGWPTLSQGAPGLLLLPLVYPGRRVALAQSASQESSSQASLPLPDPSPDIFAVGFLQRLLFCLSCRTVPSSSASLDQPISPAPRSLPLRPLSLSATHRDRHGLCCLKRAPSLASSCSLDILDQAA